MSSPVSTTPRTDVLASSSATEAAPPLVGFRYLKQFGHLFQHLHDCGTASDTAGNRTLFYDQYASLILLYFFNPTLTSLRGLQELTATQKVQKATGGPRLSLGALSEAVTCFDPELLRPLLAQLAQQAVPVVTGHEAEALRGLTAVDGTFFRALPRMAWALWRDGHKGIKAHVHFNVFKAVPEEVTLTAAACSEIEQFRQTLQPDRLYVNDRGYVCYRLFADIVKAGSSFIIRVHDNVAYEVEQERPVSDAAGAAGVIRDVTVRRLGTSHHKDELKQTVRLVWVATGQKEADGTPQVLVLCTDRLELEADLVALAYQYRWWVELFFRWLKSILGCRHLLSQKPQGVAIQIYLALIASVMISLWVGVKPTKRLYEWLCLYFQGAITEEELERFLHDLKHKQQQKQRQKQNTS